MADRAEKAIKSEVSMSDNSTQAPAPVAPPTIHGNDWRSSNAPVQRQNAPAQDYRRVDPPPPPAVAPTSGEHWRREAAPAVPFREDVVNHINEAAESALQAAQ